MNEEFYLQMAQTGEQQSAKRNQLAVSSWQLAAIRTTDYKTASSKKSTPLPGFSKFRFAYCILLTANCLLVSSGGAKR